MAVEAAADQIINGTKDENGATVLQAADKLKETSDVQTEGDKAIDALIDAAKDVKDGGVDEAGNHTASALELLQEAQVEIQGDATNDVVDGVKEQLEFAKTKEKEAEALEQTIVGYDYTDSHGEEQMVEGTATTTFEDAATAMSASADIQSSAKEHQEASDNLDALLATINNASEETDGDIDTKNELIEQYNTAVATYNANLELDQSTIIAAKEAAYTQAKQKYDAAVAQLEQALADLKTAENEFYASTKAAKVAAEQAQDKVEKAQTKVDNLSKALDNAEAKLEAEQNAAENLADGTKNLLNNKNEFKTNGSFEERRKLAVQTYLNYYLPVVKGQEVVIDDDENKVECDTSDGATKHLDNQEFNYIKVTYSVKDESGVVQRVTSYLNWDAIEKRTTAEDVYGSNTSNGMSGNINSGASTGLLVFEKTEDEVKAGEFIQTLYRYQDPVDKSWHFITQEEFDALPDAVGRKDTHNKIFNGQAIDVRAYSDITLSNGQTLKGWYSKDGVNGVKNYYGVNNRLSNGDRLLDVYKYTAEDGTTKFITAEDYAKITDAEAQAGYTKVQQNQNNLAHKAENCYVIATDSNADKHLAKSQKEGVADSVTYTWLTQVNGVSEEKLQALVSGSKALNAVMKANANGGNHGADFSLYRSAITNAQTQMTEAKSTADNLIAAIDTLEQKAADTETEAKHKVIYAKDVVKFNTEDENSIVKHFNITLEDGDPTEAEINGYTVNELITFLNGRLDGEQAKINTAKTTINSFTNRTVLAAVMKKITQPTDGSGTGGGTTGTGGTGGGSGTTETGGGSGGGTTGGSSGTGTTTGGTETGGSGTTGAGGSGTGGTGGTTGGTGGTGGGATGGSGAASGTTETGGTTGGGGTTTTGGGTTGTGGATGGSSGTGTTTGGTETGGSGTGGAGGTGGGTTGGAGTTTTGGGTTGGTGTTAGTTETGGGATGGAGVGGASTVSETAAAITTGTAQATNPATVAIAEEAPALTATAGGAAQAAVDAIQAAGHAGGGAAQAAGGAAPAAGGAAQADGAAQIADAGNAGAGGAGQVTGNAGGGTAQAGGGADQVADAGNAGGPVMADIPEGGVALADSVGDNDGAETITATITDDDTATAAAAEVPVKPERMNWWWVLIIAVLGERGRELYVKYKKENAPKN